jgi:hypothetical protein
MGKEYCLEGPKLVADDTLLTYEDVRNARVPSQWWMKITP